MVILNNAGSIYFWWVSEDLFNFVGMVNLSKKNIIQYAVMLVVAVGLLYLSFRKISWGEFIAGLKQCNWWWIGATMFFGFAGFVIRGARWNLLLREVEPNTPLKAAYDGVTIGYLANFAFPRIGEVVRCITISSYPVGARKGKTASAPKSSLTFESALGTVIVERGWDLICLVAIAVIFTLIFWKEFGLFIKTNLFGGVKNMFGSAATAGVIFIVFIAIVIALLRIFRNNRFVIKIVGAFKKILSNLKQGLLSAFRMKGKWSFMLLTILLWGSYLLTSKCTLMAMPALASLSWADALFLMFLGGFGWAIPVQGGIGAYHFIIALALSQLYGIADSNAVVFATISHEAQAFMMILCGAISLISYTTAKRAARLNKQ